MDNDLYFIPLIAKAMVQANRQEALTQALKTVQAMGQEPAYANGYRQFMILSGEVARHAATLDDELTRFSLVNDAMLDAWASWIDKMKPMPTPVGVLIEKDGVPFWQTEDAGLERETVIGNVHPGAYCLRTDTGRLLWRGPVTDTMVYWERAYPRQPLRLAADTFGAEARPTHEVSLLHGTIQMRFYPGLESGRITLNFRTRDDVR